MLRDRVPRGAQSHTPLIQGIPTRGLAKRKGIDLGPSTHYSIFLEENPKKTSGVLKAPTDGVKTSCS